MAKEPQAEVGTWTESCKTASPVHPDVAGSRRSRIPERVCDGAMAPLLGVQIRRRGGPPVPRHGGMCRAILLDDHGPRRVQSGPEDEHRAGAGPLDMAEGHQAISPPLACAQWRL
jgi:hypothetical protein